MVGISDTASSNDNGAAVTSSVTVVIAIMTVSRGHGELIRVAASIPARQRASVMALLETCMVFSPNGLNMCVIIDVRFTDEMKSRNSYGLGALIVV